LILALTLLTISTWLPRLLIVCDLRRFSAIANQESLSGLEVEMRKLEGVVKEIVDEMGYLEEREQRFSSTNSASCFIYDSSN